MQISKDAGRLLGRQGRRPAQGDRQEEPRRRWPRSSPSSVEGCRANGVLAGVIDWLWTTNEKLGRLLVQQVPRRLLRADRLPHRLAEGQLPRRVHGRADLLGHGHEGQGPVLRRQGRGHGDRHPAARREPLRPRVRGRRRQHPLRPRRGEGRRLRGGRGDQGGARGGRASSSRSGTSARASTRARSTSARSRRSSSAAPSAPPAPRARACSACSSRRRPPGQQAQLDAQIGQGSIFDLGDLGGGDAAPPSPFMAPQHPPIPPRGVRAGRAAGHREGGHRALHLRAPAQGGARGAARRRRRPAGRRCPTARTATGSRPGASSPRPRRSARRRATR